VKTFFRAILSALAATVIDFGSLTFFVEVLHGFYPVGVAIGAFLGAITNFLINRYWSFEGAHRAPVHGQIWRYLVVSAGSLGLNTLGVYLVTENFGLFYLKSKIVVALLVGWCFNYPLQKYFVYRNENRPVVVPI
jgi:putative flippase GtrA